MRTACLTSRLAIVLGLAVAAAGLACSRSRSTEGADPPSGGASAPEAYAQGRLELDADPDAVLVRISGTPVLTVGEFNARLGEFPVRDEGQDLAVARRQVVDQMIDHKVIAREALKRQSGVNHPIVPGPAYATERAMAFELIKSQVANPGLVSEAEARQYQAEQPQLFRQLDAAGSSEEERMMYVKFSLLSSRFQEKVRAWRGQEVIEVSDEFLTR